MIGDLQRLYPSARGDCSLRGLYLAHDLRGMRSDQESPLVFANFITSLDGKIAVPADGGLSVPKSIANDRDWRLFHELAAQADVILTSGRYLRDRSRGAAQEIFDPDDAAFADLRQWRADRKLSSRPAIAIISASLDFPIPDDLLSGDRVVIVVTTENADANRFKALADNGIDVIAAGEDSVCGKQLVNLLMLRGLGTIYSAAGPRVLHLLVKANVLDRLYMTVATRVIGGDTYAGMVEGPALDIPPDMSLYELYLDRDGAHGCSQLFFSFDRAGPTAAM